MADGDLLLMLNEDGKFELYNPEFDITITCKSKEEQEANIEKLKKALNSLNAWDKVKEEIEEKRKCHEVSMHRPDAWKEETCREIMDIINKHLGELQQQEGEND